MSAELRSLVVCSKKTAVARTAAHCNLPSSGVVEVEVQLSSASKDVVQLLEQSGLKIKNGSGTTTVTGDIAVNQLETLTLIEEVRSITRTRKQALNISPLPIGVS